MSSRTHLSILHGVVLFAAALAAFCLPLTVQAACGVIPGGYPIYGAASFAIGNSGTVTNGGVTQSINGGSAYSGSLNGVDASTGGLVSTALTLPTLEPSSFPEFSGTGAPGSPIPAGVYSTVNVSTATVFSGGTYYIETLNINNNRTAQLAPGDYYIRTLNFGSGAALTVSPAGTVRIFIREELSNGPGGAQFNVGGSAANTQIFLYPGADFTLGSNVNFVGMVYAPGASSKVQIGSNVNFTGALMTQGTMTLGNSFHVTVDSSLGSVSTCYSSVLASYRMDEGGWTGSGDEVADSSGNGLDGRARNGATTASATPAVSGSPGTCGYGKFDGSNDYVELTGFPNLTTNFTVTAWIRTTNSAKSGQRILVDDENNRGGYGVSLGDGGTGRVRFYNRNNSGGATILDTTNVVADDSWYFVAAVADITNRDKTLYVFDAAGTRLAGVTQTMSYWLTDAGTASIGGETNGSTEASSAFRFSGDLDEVSVINGALNESQILSVMATTRACAPSATPGAFNAFETATAPAAITGVVKTKVAGQAFDLAVVAINSAGTGVETGYTGDVKLELVDASAGASCSAYATIRSLGTLNFAAADQGRKTYGAISESEAWPDVRVRISYPASGTPSIVACSTDNFAIRPASFGGVTVSDADSFMAGTGRSLYSLPPSSISPNGGDVHRAGRPFRIAATAYNAAGAVTTKYAGSPAASLNACLLPASGCTLGTLATGTWGAAGGTVTTTTATYTEAGAFRMQLVDANFAAVDADDGSSAAERTIESAAFDVGRFVPDHFDLAVATTPQFKTFNDTTCPARSFTYVGQPFGYVTLPQATITAKNAGGDTTTNYSGALWKLTAADATQTHAASSTLDTGLIGTPVIVETGGGTGTLTADAADVLAFTRGAPVVPFSALIDLSMSVRDDAENGVTGNGTIDTTTPALFDDIAFDAGNEFRFGQLVLANAHGSELLALPMLIEAKYWNGTGFTRNAADQCTQLSANHVELVNWRRDLTACETSVALAGRFVSGRGNLRLSAPGGGNTGSVDVRVNLDAVGSGNGCVAGSSTSVTGAAQTWLQGNWAGTGYTQNPAARASFGLHRSSRALIYIREMH